MQCISSYSQLSAALSIHQGNVSLPQMETTTENHNQSKCRVVEPSPNGYIYKTLQSLKFREHCEKGVERLQESEDRGASCEIVSPGNSRSYTHEVSQTQQLRQLNKDNNRLAKVDGGKTRGPLLHTRGPRNAES